MKASLPNSKSWPLQMAKSKLEQIIREAKEHGPQLITIQGKSSVFLVSADDYSKLKTKKNEKLSFVDFIRKSPFYGLKLKITKDNSLCRNIDL